MDRTDQLYCLPYLKCMDIITVYPSVNLEEIHPLYRTIPRITGNEYKSDYSNIYFLGADFYCVFNKQKEVS